MMGGNAETAAVEDLRKAIRTAMRGISSEMIWPNYCDYMYLNTNDEYTTGTITYTAATRTVVLTGGSWPSWADLGSLIIDTQHARVQKVIDSTTLTIMADDEITADYTGTYTLYQYRYRLNTNHIIYKIGKIQVDEAGYCEYMPPSIFETDARRRYLSSSGTPRYFTINRDFKNTGQTILSIWPYSTTERRLRFGYVRHPNDIKVWSYEVGQVTTVAGAAVTGTNTVFSSVHEGCLLRTGSDQVNAPTDQDGMYPFVDEAVIDTVTDAENIVMAESMTTAQTTVAYVVSSIVDIDSFTQQELLLYRARLELAKLRSMENIQNYAKDYNDALYSAKCQANAKNSVSVAGSFRRTNGWAGLFDSYYVLS